MNINCYAHTFANALQNTSIKELEDQHFMNDEVLAYIYTDHKQTFYFRDFSMLIIVNKSLEVLMPRTVIQILELNYPYDNIRKVKEEDLQELH